MISEHRDFYVSERRNYHYEKNKRIFEQYNIIVAELKNEVIGFCRYDYNNYY